MCFLHQVVNLESRFASYLGLKGRFKLKSRKEVCARYILSFERLDLDHGISLGLNTCLILFLRYDASDIIFVHSFPRVI